MNIKRNSIIALSSFAMGALLIIGTASTLASTTPAATESSVTAEETIPVPTPTIHATVGEMPDSYIPPVLNCEAGTVPGWINEYGDATSCVDNHACVATDTQDWDCNPIVIEPVPVPTVEPVVTPTPNPVVVPNPVPTIDFQTYSLVACSSDGEDLSINCYWDAATMGNKLGESFVQLNGIVYYQK